MNQIVLQYLELENLLAEADGAVRVHVLEQTRTTSSNMLTWREITIGLCARAIVPGGRILSWYGEIAKLGFYAHTQAGNGDSSPEKEAYQVAWQRARALQAELAARLRQQGYVVHTDGLLEMNVANWLRGSTDLVSLPAKTSEVT
ncbi:MAG: hypothetical protein R3E31_02595 [Chloroflexota bacterium]